MENNNDRQLPTIYKSQDDIANDDAMLGHKQPLKRHSITLPDLTRHIDPTSPFARRIVEGLMAFNLDRGGLAHTSLSMLASVLRRWKQYCENKGAYAFPISETFALGWLKYERYVGNKAVPTIRQYRAQLSYLLNWLNLDNPFASQVVIGFMRGLVKDQVEVSQKAFRQAQAFGMRSADLLSIVDVLDVRPLKNLRNLALGCTAYSTMLREGELGRIRLQDIEILEDNTLIIHRTQSKTSSSVEAKMMIGLFAGVMRVYLHHARKQLKPEHFIFSEMSGGGKFLRPTVAMSGETVDRCLGALYDVACQHSIEFMSPNPRRWTGHSGRCGGVQDAYVRKMEIAEMMRLGDWQDPKMVLHYIRELSYKDNPNVTNQELSLQEHYERR
ncbi:Phage integrase family protein [Vibrio thalassae]|uniref:Phage integrase family protein n=1 Tax=Vibrio thalassae TaxID=1243014 RepID=A0A240EH80_9VIBR|nr:tyrosine-type recombinase/integrase [Vibrio thalassae]SNX47896.1 Phage integrase family protein [Vibrio thalassae]